MDISSDTIAAIATPPGNGGVGIIRISGILVKAISAQLIKAELRPRSALFAKFYDDDEAIIDSGIALFFPSPASYTGEDVLELQAHGGRIVLNMLLHRALGLGARMAKAGEFTERAFLNGKLDLAQAEAVADLIESETEQCARSAQRSLQGLFSEKINELLNEITELRIYIEAAIDFVDEEIDFLSDGLIEKRLVKVLQQLETIQQTARQGSLLRDGMTVVLAGKPNAGKSSLLNVLAGYDAAIVTEIAGTTRDVLRERVQLDGMPLHIVDTAGLHNSDNPVEKEGMRRAHEEIRKADKVIQLIDIQDKDSGMLTLDLPEEIEVIRVYNKIDLVNSEPKIKTGKLGTDIYLSVKNGNGLALLTQYLKESMGYVASNDNVFIARTRHLEALKKTKEWVESALEQLQNRIASELVAEDLRCAQQALSEITGEFSSDDLLGKIFSSFCIGK